MTMKCRASAVREVLKCVARSLSVPFSPLFSESNQHVRTCNPGCSVMRGKWPFCPHCPSQQPVTHHRQRWPAAPHRCVNEPSWDVLTSATHRAMSPTMMVVFKPLKCRLICYTEEVTNIAAPSESHILQGQRENSVSHIAMTIR